MKFRNQYLHPTLQNLRYRKEQKQMKYLIFSFIILLAVLQIAYYYTYLSQFEDIDPKSIYILAVGNTPPYLSSLFHITEQELEYGLNLMNVALNRLKICEELGYFPGVEVSLYDPTTQKIEDNGVIDLDTYFKRDFVV